VHYFYCWRIFQKTTSGGSMIIYEVNLSINKEIFEKYKEWLVKHAILMLDFKGFKTASFLDDLEQDDGNTIKLTVQYTIETKQDLDDYLSGPAKDMREDGIKRFGTKFSAFRRIFSLSNQFQTKAIAAAT
jgi:hypothetical protein